MLGPATNRAFFANSYQVSFNQLVNLRHLAGSLRQSNKQRQSAALLSGNHASPRKGRGMDFDEVRLYQPGDDVRNIDWRVTAKTGKAYTKIYREEQERPVLFLLDQGSSLFFGSRNTFKSVLACEITALLAWHAQSQNDKVGGAVYNDTQYQIVNPKRNKQSTLALLKTAAEFNQQLFQNRATYTSNNNANPVPAETSPQEQALQQVQSLISHGASLYFLSDFLKPLSPFSKNILRKLKQHNQLMFIHLYDVLEQQLPTQGSLKVSNGQQQCWLNCESEKLRRHYQERYQENYQDLQNFCLQNRIPVIEAGTQDSPLDKAREALFTESRL